MPQRCRNSEFYFHHEGREEHAEKIRLRKFIDSMTTMTEAIVPTAKSEPLLSVENLEVRYRLGPDRVLTAVDKVSFELYPGETLGLVGESGCGKSSLGRAILQLIRPASGRVVFLGQDLTQLAGAALRSMRRQMQIVFQDPRGSLNPRWTVGRIVEEPLRVHRVAESVGRAKLARSMLAQVGLAASHFDQRPAQLSGGQQQRVGIARALVTRPKLVVCDEPVSSLDVSIQAQILNLLQELKENLGVAYLFVAHNLGVVRSLSDRVAVMYLGQFVECAPSAKLFDRPLHPYTKGLIASVLSPDLSAREQLDRAASFAAGDIPGLLNAPSGCRYHTRCPYAEQRCREERPVLENAGSVGDQHRVACHFWREISPISLDASL
jgi:peptide/nickel transport system ATP-binding protein